MKKILASVTLCFLSLLAIGAAIYPNADGTFDCGTVAVTDATNYVEVANILADGHPLLIDVSVGTGGNIAHLMICQSVQQGATTRPLATDTDLATPTVAVPYVLTTQPAYTCTGGSGFQVKLDSGAADYVIYAKKASTDTTVRITGRVL